jgi:NAD-dependent DNA ligase
MEDHFFYNKLVVITGMYKNHTYDELKDIFISFGAGVQPVVTRKTDYVIVGTSPDFTAMELASAYNKKILYEDDLIVWI